jgi:Holliday junction resolvase-like predicted endonuclease
VDQRKQHKLRLTAEFYLQRHPTNKQPRFDVVALYADKGMDTRPLPVRQIKNAF